MSTSMTFALRAGVLGFALAMIAGLVSSARPDIALVRALTCGLVLSATTWIALAMLEQPKSEDQPSLPSSAGQVGDSASGGMNE